MWLGASLSDLPPNPPIPPPVDPPPDNPTGLPNDRRSLVYSLVVVLFMVAVLGAALLFQTLGPEDETAATTTTTTTEPPTTTTTEAPTTTTTQTPTTSTSTTRPPATTTTTRPASTTTTTVPVLGAPVVGFSTASFKVECDKGGSVPLTFQGPIDPIVVPGTVGATHSHDFVGAIGIGPNTTPTNLLSMPSSCRPAGDHSAYWVPTLLDAANKPVNPTDFDIYYVLGNGNRPGLVQSVPNGLQYVSGNSKATTAQSRNLVSWGCVATGADEGSNSSDIPTCAEGQKMVQNVRYPSCWDGKTLKATDFKSNLVFKRDETCPADHPVQLPQISYAVRYAVSGPEYHISPGSQYAVHGDLMVAWDPAVMADLVKRCINEVDKCRP